MQSIEITKHNTLCCNAPVHIKHIRLPNYESQDPYCSKCGKFPEAPLSALKAALKELKKSIKLNKSTDVSGSLYNPNYPIAKGEINIGGNGNKGFINPLADDGHISHNPFIGWIADVQKSENTSAIVHVADVQKSENTTSAIVHIAGVQNVDDIQLTPTTIEITLQQSFDKWCKQTKRNGNVLVGSSIREFFAWHEAKRYLPENNTGLQPLTKNEIEAGRNKTYKTEF